MPEAQTSTNNSVRPMERRLQVRHRLSDLVYADIGAANGGIVLELSKEGLRLQAVGPLDRQEELRLRFKTPGSQAKVEAKAKIVWLNDTNRQAGARLVDLAPDTRLQIQNWIQLLASPVVPPEESRKPQGIVSSSSRELEPNQGTRRGKWLSLMREFDFPTPGLQEPAKAGGRDWTDQMVAPTHGPDGPQIPKAKPGNPAESAKQRPAAQQAPKPDSHKEGYQARSATSSVGRESDTNPKVSRGHPGGMDVSIPAELMPVTRSQGVITPEPLDTPLGSTEHLSDGLAPSLRRALLDTRKVAHADTPKNGVTRKRAAIAIIFALCAIVFFGTGTWVGRFTPRRHAAQTAVGQISQSQTIEPARSKSAAPEPAPMAPATAHERPSQHSPKRPTVENLKFPLSLTPPNGLPSDQKAQPEPRASTGPSSDSPPATTLPEHGPSATATATPAPEDSAAPAPGPRVIGERELKPSDRFNPSHLTYRVEPTYPAQALLQGVEGAVKIEQMIGADGNVRSVKLLSGPPLLASAALDAARYWRYLPALLNSHPIESVQEVTIEFRLPRR